MDEKDAVRKLKEGDKKAFEHLYQHYWTKVYNFTHLYIVSTADAEEIVHDVFVKLWEIRTFIDENKNFDGFLFIMTRNLIFNHSRRSFNETFYQLTAVEAIEESYNIEEELIASDLHSYIDSLIALLSPRCQEVFRLSREEHLSYKEIAERLGLSEKTVEHHIANALKFLKKNLLLYAAFCQILAITPSAPSMHSSFSAMILHHLMYRF